MVYVIKKSTEPMPFGKYDCLVMLEDVCVLLFVPKETQW